MDRSVLRRSLAFGLASLALSAGLHAEDPYVVGGPASSLVPSSGDFAFDGAHFADYRAALENPAYFGAGGLVQTPVQTRTLSNLDEAQLATLDALVVAHWDDADLNPNKIDAILEFFLDGGDLILVMDDIQYDTIASRLGLGLHGDASGDFARGLAPTCDGPFGTAGSINLYGRRGELFRPNVRTAGGVVGAITDTGEVTTAWFNEGAFGPRCGALFIHCDVSTITHLADYTGLNANARFALNSTAFLAERQRIEVIGGPAASLTPGSDDFAWDGGSLIADFRDALEDESRFGPDGIVDRKVYTVDLEVCDREHLGMLTRFCVPLWYNGDLDGAFTDEITRHFWYERGNLVLCSDFGAAGEIPAALGLPIQGIPSIDEGIPLVEMADGPFGVAPKVFFEGSYGWLSQTDIDQYGGTALMRTIGNEPTMAWFGPREYANLPVAGSLLLMADVDMIATREADYDGMNWNATYALNAMAYAMTSRPYLMTGPDDSFDVLPVAWDGSAYGPFRGAVENPSHFGPLGTVHRRIFTSSTGNTDPVHLAKFDCWVTGRGHERSYEDEELEAVLDFFKRGGDLLVTQDATQYDPIGEALNLYAHHESTTDNYGYGPLFDGPFGAASPITNAQHASYLDLGAVTIRGGELCSINDAGHTQVAYWTPSAYDARAGAMVLCGDTDFFASEFGVTSYSPLNENGRFALNCAAYLVDARRGHGASHYAGGGAGSGGLVPTLDLEGSTALGKKLELHVENGLGRAPFQLLVGLNGRDDLDFKSCKLVVRPPWIILRGTLLGSSGVPGTGVRSYFVRLPDDPALVGTRVNLQALVLDQGAPQGLAASAGLEFTLENE